MTQDKRSVVDYTRTFSYVDVDAILTEEFGEAWTEYRRQYLASINYDKTGHIPAAPLTLDLELVNKCNLRCTMCFGDHHKGTRHSLDLEQIRSTIHEFVAAGGKCIQVGMGSELLLYENVIDVLRIAREEGVLDIWVFTNGVLMDQAFLDALVKYRVARLNVSFDAATRETYHKVRGQDHFDLLEKNIDALIATKAQAASKLPVIRLTFVVQQQNLHEVDMFVERWKDKVGYIDFQRYVSYEGLKDLPWGNQSIDAPSVPSPGNSYCPLPFNCLNVWANGDVTPCCFYFGPHGLVLGNVKEMSLKEIWAGEPLKKVRDGLLSGNVNPTCATCIANRSQHEPLLEKAGRVKKQVAPEPAVS